LSIELINENDGLHTHSVLIGKKMVYCMDCGKILLEYKNKKQFYNWLRSFETIGDNLD